MNEKSKRNWLLALGILLAAGPVAVMMVNLFLGMVLLIPGAAGATMVAYRLREGGGTAASNRASGIGPRTIYVQLVDDDGNDLDAAETERRLAEARLRARPQDKVLGVLHRVE